MNASRSKTLQQSVRARCVFVKLFGSDVSSKRAALFGKKAKTTDKQRDASLRILCDDDDDAFVLHDSDDEGIERIHE